MIFRSTMPVSSLTSLNAVSSIVSPLSFLPLGKSHLFLRKIKRVSSKLFLTIPPPAGITLIFFLKLEINFSEFL